MSTFPEWAIVTNDSPPISARVLIWHPDYGVLLVHRRTKGFFEANMGKLTEVTAKIRWWMDLPSEPYGEPVPFIVGFAQGAHVGEDWGHDDCSVCDEARRKPS